jgi:hypothetical protein
LKPERREKEIIFDFSGPLRALFEEHSVADLFSTSNPFKNSELLNHFSELTPILFLIQSYSPIGSAGEKMKDTFITQFK